jgi:hypothetical protein
MVTITSTLVDPAHPDYQAMVAVPALAPLVPEIIGSHHGHYATYFTGPSAIGDELPPAGRRLGRARDCRAVAPTALHDSRAHRWSPTSRSRASSFVDDPVQRRGQPDARASCARATCEQPSSVLTATADGGHIALPQRAGRFLLAAGGGKRVAIAFDPVTERHPGRRRGPWLRGSARLPP